MWGPTTDYSAPPPFSVRVAAGPPTDTTTVFIPLAVPPVAVAGRPDSAWVAPQQDEPGSSYEADAITVAKAFVAALAEGSEAHGRVVSTDAELVAVR
jgi:hypothetical protein